MQAEFAFYLVAALGILGFGVHRFARHGGRVPARPVQSAPECTAEGIEKNEFQVSYATPEFEWSGHANATIPLKTLTYKQYECLEDARYGFRIVGRSPSERKLPQVHKTRAHSLKTVASLLKHGFLYRDESGGHLITDHGLNALEVCSVRY